MVNFVGERLKTLRKRESVCALLCVTVSVCARVIERERERVQNKGEKRTFFCWSFSSA